MACAVVACPSCAFRFNYRYTPGASITAIRLGTTRIFRCPRCRQRATFELSHPGPDPALPTYADPLGVPFVAFLALALGGPLALALAWHLAPTSGLSPGAATFLLIGPIGGAAAIAASMLLRSELRSVPAD